MSRRHTLIVMLAALAVLLSLAPSTNAAPEKPTKRTEPASETPPSPDPAARGSHAVITAEYHGGPTVLTDPEGLTYPAEIHGVAHFPASGTGPFPLVIYLHGNHGTCSFAGAELVGYPCPTTPLTGPVPNYRGYDYLGENIASHGYIAVSIDANAVNTYNVAGDRGAHERAQLIARTIDLFAAMNTNSDLDVFGGQIHDLLVGRVDLSRIGMMGHSRGGEGVSMFITYNENRTDGPRYPLRAVLALAGTDYNMPRTSGVHFGTLLPLCDGDVHDLQAAFAYDRHRFDDEAAAFDRVQFTVAGTNHNFYNTVWVNDDFSTSSTAGRCSSGAAVNDRLSAADTRRVGLVLVNGFLRTYVGGETEFGPLMTGAGRLPASACPTDTTTCEHLVGRSYLGPAAKRRVVAPNEGEAALTTTAGLPLTTSGALALSACDPRPDGGTDGKNRDAGTASGCPSNPYRSRARALTLEGSGRLLVPLEGASVTQFDALTFRVATNFRTPTAPGPDAPELTVSLVDRRGRRAVARVADLSSALVPMASDASRKLTLNGVVIPLTRFREGRVDLRSINRIELDLVGGSIQVTELAFQSGVLRTSVSTS